MDDIKKKLNPSQWDAVSTIDGPLLVVAGAGTGKTRVIEYRCLYMIEKGIAPEHILILTFTRKAAREMVGRAALHDAVPKDRRRHISLFCVSGDQKIQKSFGVRRKYFFYR